MIAARNELRIETSFSTSQPLNDLQTSVILLILKQLNENVFKRLLQFARACRSCWRTKRSALGRQHRINSYIGKSNGISFSCCHIGIGCVFFHLSVTSYININSLMNEYAIELNSLRIIFEAGWKVKSINIELKSRSSSKNCLRADKIRRK